jgi:DNA polymerase III alpha subunit
MDKKIKFANCDCEVVKGEFDINNIPLDCRATWRLISSGYTVGVFQLEKQLGQDWARKVKPNNIQELASLTALLRPGCLECIGENTKIIRRSMGRGHNKNGKSYWRSTIGQLYKDWVKFQSLKYKGDRQLSIYSVDEKSGKLVKNKIKKVFYKGRGTVYSVKVRTSWTFTSQANWLDIRATENHLFLTNNGWKRLGDLRIGDYVAIFTGKSGGHIRKDFSKQSVPGQVNFRNIAFYNYEYKCVFCNWNKGSLDVNHLIGNRKSNNNPSNLVWLCPNHHRMYTERKITKEEVIEKREKYKLPYISDTRFVRIEEIKNCGQEKLYDISVENPHNNYIAGNFVVHNSGMTQEYVDIKFRKKEQTYLHPSLKPILESTYGCLVYQEQAIRMAVEIAGFNLEEADNLRKAMGKKSTELMSKAEKQFIEGCKKMGIIARTVAEEVFGWIRKSQRYSFNKSHAQSYGELAYQTAWLKTHFPYQFFVSYLIYSQFKGDPKEEIYKLVQDARLFGIKIFPPDIRRKNIQFEITTQPEKGISFGLGHIKGVGQSAINKIVGSGEKTLKNWPEFLASIPDLHRNVGIALIKSGACDCYNYSRSEMVRCLEVILGTTTRDEKGNKKEIRGLTPKEQEWFFDKLLKGENAKDILARMVEISNNLRPRLKDMKKPELIQLLDEELGGAVDGSKCKKDEIIAILKEQGHEDPERGPCSTSKRREIIKEKAKILSQDVRDTNLAKSMAEKYFLGISISCSAVDDADKSLATHTCLDIAKSPNKSSVRVCAIIESVRHTKTKRGKNPGQAMCFLNISDSTYAIDRAVVFPDAYKKLKSFCKEDLICLIIGEKRNGSFIIEDIQKLM